MIKFSKYIAIGMLVLMFVLMLASSWNDSAIFDEVAHIPAGYTSLTLKDGRLNPEHPPLLKDLAALPLLFLNIKFDKNQPFWDIENVNDRQWATGNYLLYEAGNDADQILFWARLPMILLTIFFGWLLFWWVKNKYGDKIGLLTLFFFVTSPTFLAHGRYVATDVGAALGFFLGIIFFLKFLEKQNLKSAVWLGVIFGLINLFKFSLVLLLPIYLILIIRAGWKLKTRLPDGQIGNLLLAALIALSVINTAYIPQVWNYPTDQQIKDVHYILAGYKFQSLAKLDFWLVEHSLTRPLGHYFYGFLMVAQRAAGGNTAYFEGEVSSKGWWSYFPTLAIVKEQLGFYIFALLALFTALKNKAKPDFTSLSAIVFIIFYWISSVLNPLNIGVRHMLPTFPFLYFLVAKEIAALRKNIFVWLIMLWMVTEIAIAFPYYLSYYNALGGGLKNGYKIATDSNYDWGQDLRRLKALVEKNPALARPKIYLDYFGGGSPKYYLGEKYEPWWSAKGMPPSGSYFAVSLNSLVGSENFYPWLRGLKPFARAGSSILIYKIESRPTYLNL